MQPARCDKYDPAKKFQQVTFNGYLISNANPPELVLDVYRNNPHTGTEVIGYKFNDGINQRWLIEFVND